MENIVWSSVKKNVIPSSFRFKLINSFNCLFVYLFTSDGTTAAWIATKARSA